MANNTITINRIIAIFRDLSIRHEMINDFGFGETSDIGASRPMLFPYLWVEPTTTRITQGNTANRYQELFYSFNIYLMDKIQKGDDNFEDTLSDTNYILATIVREMSQHPYYVDMNVSLSGDVVFDPATEATDDNVNGWIAQFTLKIPLRYGYCETPIEAISGWTSSLTPEVTQYRLIGPQGFQGPSGPAGTPGTPGGPQGLQGPTGAQGLNGLTGGQGSTGPQGLVGNTGAGGALGYFISAYDTTIQTNQGATFANQFSYDTTAEFNGISIQNGTQVLFDYPGTYNLQFSAQVEKTDAGSDEIEIWLSKNGTNVDWSNTTLELQGNNTELVAAWNFVLTVNSGDYLELNWHSNDLNMRILSRAATSNPTRPEIPSIILTVTQVMYTQIGPTGPQGVTGPNDLGLQTVLINDSLLTQSNTIDVNSTDLLFTNASSFEVNASSNVNIDTTNSVTIKTNDTAEESGLFTVPTQAQLRTQDLVTSEYTEVTTQKDKLFIITPGVVNSSANIGDVLQLTSTSGRVEFASISGVQGPTGPDGAAGPAGSNGTNGAQGPTGPTAQLTFQQTLINGATLSQNNQVELQGTNFTWNKPDRFLISNTSSTAGEIYTTEIAYRGTSGNETIGLSILGAGGTTGSAINISRTAMTVRTPNVVANIASVGQVLTLSNSSGRVEFATASFPGLTVYATGNNSPAYATSSTVALYSVLIPAGTVTAGDIVYIQTRSRKVGTAAVYRTRMYSNSTNNISTATLLGDLLTTGATTTFVQFERTLVVKSTTGASNNQMYPTSVTNAFTDNATTTAFLTPTIDWGSNVYILIGYTPVTGTADLINGSFVKIVIEKSNV